MSPQTNGLAASPAGVGPLRPGRPWPLGAEVTADGVNFAVVSSHATAIELCLFDADGRIEQQRLRLPGRSGDVWHGLLPGGRAGLTYGLRAWGPWDPAQGQRFNPHKLLLDPWAREIAGRFEWGPEHRGDDPNHPQRPSTVDNATTALKARVVQDHWDWGADRRPDAAHEDSVIYEVHVRGFTRQHPDVPEAQRGTYLGLASDAALAHFRQLGVTALCLLPVHEFLDEERLVHLGLVNYWGYNTVGFFSPTRRYATQPDGRHARDEFRTMVARLHAAGIEVLLDVVFNHTAETDVLGPTISWRGLDNTTWYRLPPDRRDDYVNWTGCGNTLDVNHPRGLQLVLDSLRYWVQHMHVDGFRFDLAPVLGREAADFSPRAAFFHAVQQDPVLAGVRLIAEPWDVGPHGYQLGRFPAGWHEWNDRFRDTARAFWLRGDRSRGEFTQRLCASADVFQTAGRAPTATVNYVVSHDGFTLRDLVSYDERHNAANLEGNRDGHGHNLSWNAGVEGPTQDAAVLQLRARLQRALLATLLLSQGTPMLAAGDELGHSQHGNNNPYCQDNTLSWIDWSQADTGLVAYTTHLLALRRRYLPLDGRWYSGRTDSQGRTDISWRLPDGEALTAEDWNDPREHGFGAWIAAPGHGTAALMLLFNADDRSLSFRLPPGTWQLLLDSAMTTGTRMWSGHGQFDLSARSVCLLVAVDADGSGIVDRPASAHSVAPDTASG
jgi:glycogen debranching enzyme